MSAVAGIDLTGKTVRLKQYFFEKGLKAEENLFKCEGGFGCNPASMGTKIFGTFIKDGEKCFIRREHIEAIIEE